MRSLRSVAAAGSLAVAAALMGAPAAVAAPTAVGQAPVAGTPQFSAQVQQVVHRGPIVYVVGNFGRVTDSTGTHVRRGAAAYDARTKKVLPWNPDVDGRVFAIAVGKDGVWLGGRFTTVRGKARHNLAKVGLGDTPGKLRGKFNHDVNRPIRAIALTKNRVLVGGNFTKVDTSNRGRLAAFNRKTYGLTKWRPKAHDGVVFDIKALKDRVLLAGQFRKLNGTRDYGRLAMVDLQKGRTITSFKPAVSYEVFDVAVRKKRIYAAIGGPGGGRLDSYVRKNGKRAWQALFDGDAQAIRIMKKVVYLGGHFNRVCITAGPQGNCAKTDAHRGHLAAYRLGGKLLGWNPTADSPLGIVTIDAIAKRSEVIVGGTFDTAGHLPRGKLASFR